MNILVRPVGLVRPAGPVGLARALAFGGLLFACACDSFNTNSYPGSSGPTTAPTIQIAAVGSELPTETTVRVLANGDYFFPDRAATLTTRCQGPATFTLVWTDGRDPVEQTCGGSDGAFSLNTSVGNADHVTFALETGSFADVTVY